MDKKLGRTKLSIIGMDKQYRDLLNEESFFDVERFMLDAELEEIYFYGGAFLRTQLIKSESVVCDYDVYECAEQYSEIDLSFIRSKAILQEKGYTVQTESNGTNTTLHTVILRDSAGRDFDFILKKKAESERMTGGAFNIDLIRSRLYIEDSKLNTVRIIDDYNGLAGLRDKAATFIGHTEDYNRVVKRMLVLSAKFDIEHFLIQSHGRSILITEHDTREANLENISLLYNSELSHGSPDVQGSLLKFFSMLCRVKNPFDYITKINNSGILLFEFPELSEALMSKKFLNFLEVEQKSTKRILTNELAAYNVIYENCDNKIEFCKELRKLENTRSDMKTNVCELIINKNSHNLELLCNKDLGVIK